MNDTCVGCGLCARQCPTDAIAMRDRTPVRIKDKCLLCLGRVHKCPMNAIACTEQTIGHGQYTNPHTAKLLRRGFTSFIQEQAPGSVYAAQRSGYAAWTIP